LESCRWNSLDELYWLELTFRLCFLERGRIGRWWGNVLRGGLGRALRRVCCGWRGAECAACPFRQGCPYLSIFEPRPVAHAARMRKYNAIPRPFVFTRLTSGRDEVGRGEQVDFGLTLVGSAVRWLPHFVAAFNLLGEWGLGRDRVRFRVERVSHRRNGVTLYRDGDELIKLPERLDRPEDLPLLPRREILGVHLITPLRIKYQGHLATSLPFHLLVRNLLRRLSLLAYFHCGVELAWDFRGAIGQAEQVKVLSSHVEWREWGRRSGRSGQYMRLGGLVGEIRYVGPWHSFLPLLAVGSRLHLGKAVSFGFGRYQLWSEDTR